MLKEAASDCQQRLDAIIDEIADANRRLERLYDTLETGKVRLEDISYQAGLTALK